MVAGQKSPGDNRAEDSPQAPGRLNNTQNPSLQSRACAFRGYGAHRGLRQAVTHRKSGTKQKKRENGMREWHRHHTDCHYSEAGDCQVDVSETLRKSSDSSSLNQSAYKSHHHENVAD